MPTEMVGPTQAPVLSPTPRAITSAHSASVPIRPFGPCCSVEPIGMMMPRDLAKYASTSCQVANCSCMCPPGRAQSVGPPRAERNTMRGPPVLSTRPMLEITNLTYRIAGRLLLDNASAFVPAGHHVGLVGRNGSGKSTLLNLIMRELDADGGTIPLPRATSIAI